MMKNILNNMSSYYKQTKHPVSHKWHKAMWIDDYFSSHHYGVEFPNGEIFDPAKVELETRDMPESKKVSNCCKSPMRYIDELLCCASCGKACETESNQNQECNCGLKNISHMPYCEVVKNGYIGKFKGVVKDSGIFQKRGWEEEILLAKKPSQTTKSGFEITHDPEYLIEEIRRIKDKALEEYKKELREKIKELGHQQEDDTIWCDMDEVLFILTEK